TAFNPVSRNLGAQVTISGVNFSPGAASNIVFFGAVRASVSSASSTNLIVTVPAGAQFSPITVTVGGFTAFANAPFLPTFTGDGKLDLVVCDRLNNQIAVFRNISTPGSLSSNSFAPRVNFPVGSDPRYVRVADLDGDGKPEIVSANVGDNTVSILRNTSVPGT